IGRSDHRRHRRHRNISLAFVVIATANVPACNSSGWCGRDESPITAMSAITDDDGDLPLVRPSDSKIPVDVRLRIDDCCFTSNYREGTVGHFGRGLDAHTIEAGGNSFLKSAITAAAVLLLIIIGGCMSYTIVPSGHVGVTTNFG